MTRWGRKNVQSIALHVGTRTIAQVRSHAQKYFQKQVCFFGAVLGLSLCVCWLQQSCIHSFMVWLSCCCCCWLKRKQELEVERAQKLNADIKAGGKDGGKSNANDVKTVAVQSSNTARVPSQQAAPLASSKVIRVKTESSSNRTGSSERAHNNMTNVHQNEPVSSSNQKVVTNNSNNNNSNANRIYPSSTSRDLFATTAATHSVAIHLPIDTKRNIVKRMPPTQKTNAAQRVMLVNNPISVSVESDSKNVTIASRVSSAANNKRKDNNTAHDLNVGDHSNVPTPTVVVKSEKV